MSATIFPGRFTLRTLFLVVAICAAMIMAVMWLFKPEVEQIPFDSASWKRADPIERDRTVRSQMIESLLRNHNFQGWSKAKVIALLGQPDSRLSFEQWDLVYVLGLERAGSFSLDTEALGFKLDANDNVIRWGRSVN